MRDLDKVLDGRVNVRNRVALLRDRAVFGSRERAGRDKPFVGPVRVCELCRPALWRRWSASE